LLLLLASGATFATGGEQTNSTAPVVSGSQLIVSGQKDSSLQANKSFKFNFSFSDYRGDYLGLPRPGNKPEKFAPGIISVEDQSVHGLVFSPDGKQLAYMLDDPAGQQKGIRLAYLRQIAGRWTIPTVLEFSRTGHSLNPIITADGKRIIFSRPAGKNRLQYVYCDVSEAEYSAPQKLDLSLPDPFAFSLSYYEDAAGRIYFCSLVPGNCGGTDLYRFTRSPTGNRVSPIVSLRSPSDDDSPFLSPDGQYLVFNRVSYPTTGPSRSDVMFSYRLADGEWSPPINYGKHFGATDDNWRPTFSPDGKYLFFGMKNGPKFSIYWVSASVIEELRPKPGQPTETRANGHSVKVPGMQNW